jgi:hypothetical protein
VRAQTELSGLFDLRRKRLNFREDEDNSCGLECWRKRNNAEKELQKYKESFFEPWAK